MRLQKKTTSQGAGTYQEINKALCLEAPLIIGLCGYSRVGKDTAAKALVQERYFRRIAFADPLKQCLLALNPLVPSDPQDDSSQHLHLRDYCKQVGSWTLAKEHPEVRRLTQVMGTEVGRNILDHDLWVRLAQSKIVDNTIFTDVRFPNEARLVRQKGGYLIRIDRPGYGPVNEHLSDRAFEGWSFDEIFVNDGTIQELQEKLLTWVDQHSAV